MKTNYWKRATYKIQLQQDGRIFGQEVAGVVNSGFGIHESGTAWNITHLCSGWKCFTAVSADGAKILAQYLIKNYLSDFERLKISGTTIENYKPLAEKIASDNDLAQLRKSVADDRPKATESRNQLSLKIIS